MSVEEDTELRNLVAQALENKGILPKIRAELRASVFLALEENSSTRDTLLRNEELSAFIQIPVGILILNLVREFLEFFGLDFTLSVFDPETKYGREYNAITKEKMMRDLNVTECTKEGPLLYEIISKIVTEYKDETKNNSVTDKNSVTINLNHCDVSLNGDIGSASPSANLNTTYVKSKDQVCFTPPGSEHSVAEDDHDSIEEDLSINKSSASENVSVDNASNKIEDAVKNAESQINKEADVKQQDNSAVETKSFIPIPESSTEFDLLKFTPVKETKAMEQHKIALDDSSDKKNGDEKSKANSMSTLGDLPPLNGKTEQKKNKINEIRAIINQGLNLDNSYDDDEFHSSISSKSSMGREECDRYPLQISDRSQNCDKQCDKSGTSDNVEENLDDDLNDLINNHNSTDKQLTLDETVSHLSDVADHLESL